MQGLVQLARPKQYAKNVFLFMPLIFAHQLYDLHAIALSVWAFMAFSLAASAVYVINDLRDATEDRCHPQKKDRPVASGVISAREGITYALLLGTSALLLSRLLLPAETTWIIGCYVLLNVAYSFGLKHIPILDVTFIGASFVMRLFAGAYSIDVDVSKWIVLVTFLLAVYLALAKRRDDLLLHENGSRVRKSIDGYNYEFVNSAMMIMAAVLVVSYIMYTVSPEITAKHQTDQLYLTTFWVLLGVLRYLQITVVERRSGSPTEVLFRDRFLQAVIGAWLVHVFILLYL
jgi:4-hydroxybenzoate polyprenyltransferase